MILPAVCQTLRILSFSVTALPSPNYHCRTPRETAIAPWPKHWWGHVVVNLGKQVIFAKDFSPSLSLPQVYDGRVVTEVVPSTPGFTSCAQPLAGVTLDSSAGGCYSVL